MLRVPRHATQVDPRETRLLSAWRDLDAYVLLGDPGAGKSCAFDDECKATGGVPLSARDVVAGITPTIEAGQTVFIDGLDEVRAGASNQASPFDAIRKWLWDRGRPRFRMSCREADWLGEADRALLQAVAPHDRLAVLHLDPLQDADIAAVLHSRAAEVPDAPVFLSAARAAGLADLLRNPLLLDLTIKATAGGPPPRTRAGIYEAACRQLAQEHNPRHRSAQAVGTPQVDRILDTAGMLCALLILCGKRGFASSSAAGPDLIDLSELPADAPIPDASAALRSKVFSADAQAAVPRHRSIAEFLAGRGLARRTASGHPPLARVMTLMQGSDGFPVDPMRGLWAWLAVHHAPGRLRLASIDPLGVVLNGDATQFTPGERVDVLHALQEQAARDPWFRESSWVSHPFGPLATADMAVTFAALLDAPQRDLGHLSFMDLLLDMLQHGQAMPSLAASLRAWVQDAQVAGHLRRSAYQAWRHCAGFPVEQAAAWLEATRSGALADDDDQLCGTLLHDLYPVAIGPDHVFDHWHRPKSELLIGWYRSFWRQALWEQTPPAAYPALAEAWLKRQAAMQARPPRDNAADDLSSRLLTRVLEYAGDAAEDHTLYRWLGMCLDPYGFSQLERQEESGVRTWLSARPERMKAVVKQGFAATVADAQGQLMYWPAESRLHGAPKPRDWLHWLLEQASTAATPELAAHCFYPAAHAAMEPPPDLDAPTMDEVVDWVQAHQARWPQAQSWLENAWSVSLDHWQGRQAQERRRARAQQAQQDAQRQRSLQPYLPALLNGTAPVGLLYQVAVAHEHGFSDVPGPTPLERVRRFLVSSEATAQAVIDALPLVLDRADLPTVDEALALETKGRQHYIRPAALLAARLLFDQDPTAVLRWSQALVERLTAYYLTDGTGDMPGWYREVVKARASWVAPVLVRYAAPKFKRKGQQFFAGLWALQSEPNHQAVARLALPALLNAVPARISEAARSTLNRCLLSALPALDDTQARQVVQLKLRQTALDQAQRISWLVAELPFRAAAADDLVALIGSNERRAAVLGSALQEQGSLDRVVGQPLAPHAVQRLIELLAPITTPRSWERSGIVEESHHRGDSMRALLSMLSSSTSAEAKAALLALSEAPGLQHWHSALQYSLRSQAGRVREAGYRQPTPAEAANALADRAPANPADLRALAQEHLDDLQARWRGLDSFELRQFWRDEGRTPKVENDCRDVLLPSLRSRLQPLNIVVSREHSAAQDKRADLYLEYMNQGRRTAVPIEVKKDDHRELWTAWRDQLKRLYAIDPDAQGCGLYLVLWFGIKCRTHPEGQAITSAEGLAQALKSRVPQADRHRLAIQVLDLSWPMR